MSTVHRHRPVTLALAACGLAACGVAAGDAAHSAPMGAAHVALPLADLGDFADPAEDIENLDLDDGPTDAGGAPLASHARRAVADHFQRAQSRGAFPGLLPTSALAEPIELTDIPVDGLVADDGGPVFLSVRLDTLVPSPPPSDPSETWSDFVLSGPVNLGDDVFILSLSMRASAWTAEADEVAPPGDSLVVVTVLEDEVDLADADVDAYGGDDASPWQGVADDDAAPADAVSADAAPAAPGPTADTDAFGSGDSPLDADDALDADFSAGAAGAAGEPALPADPDGADATVADANGLIAGSAPTVGEATAAAPDKWLGDDAASLDGGQPGLVANPNWASAGEGIVTDGNAIGWGGVAPFDPWAVPPMDVGAPSPSPADANGLLAPGAGGWSPAL